jgi:hypothetical protein
VEKLGKYAFHGIDRFAYHGGDRTTARIFFFAVGFQNESPVLPSSWHYETETLPEQVIVAGAVSIYKFPDLA